MQVRFDNYYLIKQLKLSAVLEAREAAMNTPEHSFKNADLWAVHQIASFMCVKRWKRSSKTKILRARAGYPLIAMENSGTVS